MADTDDELQSDELESDQRDDDTAEAIRREKERKRLRDEDELDDLRDEEIELAAKADRERDELRDRHELDAKEDTARAIHLAEVDEELRDIRRRDAGAGRLEGRRERSRGDHLIKEADSRRDEPGAEATAAAGRAHHRRANDAERRAATDDRDADRYDASARSRRSEAAQAQNDAPAVGAVQNPPLEPPVARPNVKPVKRQKKNAERDTSGQPDLTLGPR